jgi:NTE family protein
VDPLRRVLSETLDVERLRQDGPVRLFVNATNVRTNQIRVFAGKELGLDVLCASSCLPFLFDPVEIDGEPYWDGAFLGNPAIYPLIYGGASSDILLIQSPLCIEEPPASAAGLLERISEVAFTSTLIREMRSIAFVTDLLDQGKIKEEAGMRRVRMHVIEAEPAGEGAAEESRFSAEWPALERLRDRGRRAAVRWLAANFDALGDALDARHPRGLRPTGPETQRSSRSITARTMKGQAIVASAKTSAKRPPSPSGTNFPQETPSR